MDSPTTLSRRTFLRRLSALAALGITVPLRRLHARLSVDTKNLPLQRVRRTALAELLIVLKDRVQPKSVTLGFFNEATSEILRQLSPAGNSTTLDRYEVLMHDNALYVFGSTPRGLLSGVFALHEALLDRATLANGLHLHGTFQFRERIFHARFKPWPGTRPDIRFLAHLGATHCLVSHDWQGNHRSLQGYVTSPIFPEAVDPQEVAANHAGLRQLLEACNDYGLGAMLWLTELPCQGGPWLSGGEREDFLRRYPAEVLSDSGTYQGKVLCFSHPRVQAFYRDLLQRFFADFPEVETFFLFGLDSRGEFCDPQTCPRCRGLSRIAQRDRLVCFLIEEGRKVRPGLRVLTTGWKWDQEPEDFLRHQAALPAASGVYYAAAKDGWQCERQNHDFLKAVRQTCRERGQTFIGYDNFHWGDDTVHGLDDIQDFPLGIGAKLKRWHALGADGVFDHWGHAPEDIWCNSVACRDFFLNPQADPVELARKIALLQFGPDAGVHVLAAWIALERAHAELSVACTWSPGQWPGWYDGLKRLPLPGNFNDTSLREHQAPLRREGAVFYNPKDFASALQAVADAWTQANPHYVATVQAMERALEKSDDSPVFYRFWWNGPQPAPSRRDHVRRQLLHVKSMALAGREIGLHIALHALWERTGHEAQLYRRQAETLLRDDIAACREAAVYFESLGKPKDWGQRYEAKATALENYLAAS